MKILSCFKTVPDIDALPDAMWVCGSDLTVDMSCVPPSWNCYEESAMALALEYAAKHKAALHALTIGGSEGFLKTLFALGFESCTSIDCGIDLRFRHELVSELIARYAQSMGGCDIILLGCRSTDGNSGLTGAFLAQRLSAALVSYATGFEPAGNGLLKVRAVTDRFETSALVEAPCVITVGNSPVSCLPVPTLKDRMRAAGRTIEHFRPSDLGVDTDGVGLQPGVRLVGMLKRENKREARLISAGTAITTAERLYAVLTERMIDQ